MQRGVSTVAAGIDRGPVVEQADHQGLVPIHGIDDGQMQVRASSVINVVDIDIVTIDIRARSYRVARRSWSGEAKADGFGGCQTYCLSTVSGRLLPGPTTVANEWTGLCQADSRISQGSQENRSNSNRCQERLDFHAIVLGATVMRSHNSHSSQRTAA